MVVEWDLDRPKDGKLLAKVPHSVYALTVDQVRNLLVIGHNFEGIHVIDLSDRKEIWNLKLTDQAIFDLKIVGNDLLIGTGDGVLIVVDMQEKSIKRHIKLSSKSIRVMSVAYGKQHLALGLSDHTVTILDIAKGYLPLEYMSGHSNSVFALGYSPDEKILISGARDAQLKFWNSINYSLEESVIAHMYAINYLTYRKDGKFLATCSMDKSIKIWDVESRKLLKVIDKARNAGHGTSINKILWSTYSDRIVSVSDDRSISIWQIEAQNL